VWAAPTKTAFLFCKLFSLRLLPAKKKATMKAEKPYGYSRLASASSLPAFSFDERCAKEKAIKKKTLIYGASPQTPRAFEKARQNFTTKVCANTPINQNLKKSSKRPQMQI
jgi:hypothetical protein